MFQQRWAALGLIMLIAGCGIHLAVALEFDMLFQTKCVMEEINKGVLVVGDFAAFNKDNTANMVSIDIKV